MPAQLSQKAYTLVFRARVCTSHELHISSMFWTRLGLLRNGNAHALKQFCNKCCVWAPPLEYVFPQILYLQELCSAFFLLTLMRSSCDINLRISTFKIFRNDFVRERCRNKPSCAAETECKITRGVWSRKKNDGTVRWHARRLSVMSFTRQYCDGREWWVEMDRFKKMGERCRPVKFLRFILLPERVWCWGNVVAIRLRMRCRKKTSPGARKCVASSLAA